MFLALPEHFGVFFRMVMEIALTPLKVGCEYVCANTDVYVCTLVCRVFHERENYSTRLSRALLQQFC